MGCPPVRKIIHSLKLVDYLHVQADNPWYNYYLVILIFQCFLIERTEKLPMNSIKAVVSEPLDGHEEYHMMVCIIFEPVYEISNNVTF